MEVDGAPGCVYSRGHFTSPRGPRLATHAWQPSAPPAAACRLFILHGYAAHGAFASVTLLGQHLAARGFAVHSLDFEGAGLSEGMPGLITDTAHLVTDALAFVAQHADGAPVFLAGTSMGGALALACTLRAPRGLFAGCVLLSPLVVLAEKARPGPLASVALQALCHVIPWAPLIGGSSGDSGAQYRDPELRALCENDPRAYKGRIRLATASALVQLCEALEAQLDDVEVPFLACHGTADTVVDIESSRRLLQRACSADKQLIEVPDALHSLMCELPPVREELLRQITAWLETRRAAAVAAAMSSA